MTFYVKLWFYVLLGTDWGPFGDPALCQQVAEQHAAQVQEMTPTCGQGYEERGLARLKGRIEWTS